MDILFLLFTGFTIGLSGAMIPGPLTFFTVSETLRTDKHAGIRVMGGHILVELAIVMVIVLGFKSLLLSRALLFAISVTGGIAFVVMGALLLRNAGKFTLKGIEPDEHVRKKAVVGGALFSVTSPGFIIWWATIGVSTLLEASMAGVAGVVTLVAGHWLADIVWYGSISYAVEKGKVYLNDKRYRTAICLLSFLLIVLGVYFLLKGLFLR
ncbi:MAG: LysE family transporter [Candidatus Omnitrophota bacterium]